MAPAPGGVISLLTDFGLRDGYVACMKAVILGLAPGVRLVDITHEVPPQSISEASYLLRSCYPYFPAGSVHLVVVDPGVGSDRRPIAVATPEHFFVGPDNGVLWSVVAEARERFGEAVRIVELAEPRFWRPQISATFHGRDIFAPVAAHLSVGVALSRLGPAISSIQVASGLAAVWTSEDHLEGRIAHVDRFGNCLTDISGDDLMGLGHADRLFVEVAGRRIHGLSRTYSDTAPGLLLALLGSNGRLEIAVRDADASAILGVTAGAVVRVTVEQSPSSPASAPS